MSERKPVVLVTGASGFVGGHVVPALARQGWSVRRAVRRPTGADDEVVIETIGPETDWQAALEGVDAVVHLAARVHHKHEEHAVQLYRNVNIAGTLHLAHSAATAGVRQFIFVSTVLVHGRSNEGRAPFSEKDILTPRGLYGMSKAAAEAGLRTLARDSAINISVIRPPLVYGAGAKGNFALLTRAVSLGLPLPFAAIHNHRAFLAVQNLSSFILRRLAHPDPASNFEIFLVADKEQVSTPEFIERLAKASGKSPRLFGMPPDLLGTLLRVIGRQDTHDSLIGSLELDISKAIATGWEPQVSLDEGLQLALSVQDA
ncbi:UDP-glucose 4-epimerase [Bradyrhizobium diazoefficiens]|jgi:UDP-glucose 4-epimerase|uniref:Bll5923 protein n=2 Tax=Bradyrhizobium diazoefficiens TaxID=1355477 RepID=Q89HR7_BRADU|nr:NAD-dependent epimerase/dehydratase family protein [Bradyrhizobium diazoefficiens]MBP1091289.1 UDP-glucose 4-epimerase [Bradyrhizobium japonicum]AND91069.1 UDP-glucose 4-epimerase [Bradyrhizobium diazoefficiens USDA 110]QBP24692.1 NAD-dependent epimerase/dehydratase family protein [Bradyrhizobium diazoefficiens]QLD42337.1 NAD-dependent epimerase/dehydratase family protein [Bradyrhizobium diazoefficiens]WLB36096.1 NAD-dependent epimerase/dehydratase family protein [Bradyrhizobium diazoeffici